MDKCSTEVGEVPILKSVQQLGGVVANIYSCLRIVQLPKDFVFTQPSASLIAPDLKEIYLVLSIAHSSYLFFSI